MNPGTHEHVSPGTPSEGSADPTRALSPQPDEQRELAHQLLDQLLDDAANLPESPILDFSNQPNLLNRIDEPRPQDGSGIVDTLERFWTEIRPSMTRVDHPRFHAFIPSSSSFPALLGQLISAATNPFVGSWLGGGSLAALEVVVLRWLAESLGCPEVRYGVLTSGGSLANLYGVLMARQRARQNMPNGEWSHRARLLVSDQAHDSIAKAARVAGFDSRCVVEISTLPDGTLDAASAGHCIAEERRSGATPIFLSANAGTTNTGAIDPIAELAELCHQERLWFHIDAAYGGPAALSSRFRHLFTGLERADSITLDPHKWLYCPMGTGCFLTRHETELEGTFRVAGNYLQDVPRDQVNFFDRGVEMSRPGRVLPLWFVLRSVGTETIARQIEAEIDLAADALRALESSGLFERRANPVLAVAAFAPRAESPAEADAQTLEIYRALAERGTTMTSTTRIEGRNALRLVVLGARSDRREVMRSVREICDVASEIRSDRVRTQPAIEPADP